MIKAEKGVSTYLLRFEDGDELAYQIDWHTGLSLMMGAIGDEFVEIMGRSL